MSQFLRAQDQLSGKEGQAFVTIDGKRHFLFTAKKIEAKIEKEKSERKSLGRRGSQHKTIGWKGTGTLSITYATDLFREMILKYINEGIDTYFDLQVINDDPQSAVGQHETILIDCNIDSSIVALIDDSAEVLEEEVPFTFEDIDIPRKFKKPNYVD
ncbi:phage tail tube protein [Abyssisolibacter fermentans]|uniref:phage tail tube protein n=1 Tax=Abyssisolibacter fermentans TaxID=1766203 RepID=UPI000834223A|nr:phage tail tube protein [Abyssisolibacter fermentans]